MAYIYMALMSPASGMGRSEVETCLVNLYIYIYIYIHLGLARLIKLQVLRISSNLITSLEGAGMENLAKLWHISLESNKLQNLLGIQVTIQAH